MNEINAFYFPSSVTVVDDNDAFLTNFGLSLSDSLSVNTFLDPHDAIDHVRTNYCSNVLSTIESVVSKEEDDDGEYPGYSIDFNRIAAMSRYPNRSDVCSAVVVDYSMPSMTGLELCEKLADIPIPRIMLTGHADFQLAVDAFNRGLISQFVVKDSPRMMEQLLQAIRKCQRDFFQLKSYPILNALELAGHTALKTDANRECFSHVVNQYCIVSYYLLDAHGTFLLVGENGKTYYFQLVANEQFDELINVAQNASESPCLVARLSDRSVLPLFLSEADRQRPVSAWDELLQPIMAHGAAHYMLVESAVTE